MRDTLLRAKPLNGGDRQFYLHEVLIKETASHIMTATQTSADTVSETVSNNSISENGEKINTFDKKIGREEVTTPQ